MTSSQPPERASAIRVLPGATVDGERVVPPRRKRRALSVEDHVEGVKAGDRVAIGRTLTLMESSNPDHREKAVEVLRGLMDRTGRAYRLGISGVPGVGKSTFIEAFGMTLVELGLRVAVLTVDPSSEVSGGSILGDKTRMENLSRHPEALVRPTACGDWHGGVARGTRESILVCEAAGFDVVMVETVGVGQSETHVASMVDFFLLLMLTGAGDELQGMKRGIIELADAVAINKADGENLAKAEVARAQLRAALRLITSPSGVWRPPVMTCSALTGSGIPEIWAMISEHRRVMEESGELSARRRRQALFCMRQAVERLLIERFHNHPAVAGSLQEIEMEVVEGRISPFAAAERLVDLATEAAPAASDGGDGNGPAG